MTKTKEEKNIETPEKFRDLVDKIEKLTVLELAELVKVLEDKFGVSAMPAASSAAVSMGAGPVDGAEGGQAEEKTSYAVELKSGGEQKINAIKAVREITGLGLKEAKDLVDGAPKILKEGIKKEEADEIKKKMEEAGATVEIK